MRLEGKISYFNNEKGFGFIDGNDGQNYFLHISKLNNIDNTAVIKKNTNIEFNPKESEKGLVAIDALIIKEPEKETANSIKSAFIKLGKYNVKKSNIKEFGLSKEKCDLEKAYHVPVYEKKGKYGFLGREKAPEYIFTGEYKCLDINQIPEHGWNQPIRMSMDKASLYMSMDDDFKRPKNSISEDAEIRSENDVKGESYREYYGHYVKQENDYFWDDTLLLYTKLTPEPEVQRYLYVTTLQNQNYKIYDSEDDLDKLYEELLSI